MTTEISPKQVKELIQKWFMEDEWSIRQQKAPDAAWAFVADDGLGRKVVVGQKVGREDQLVIQAGIQLDDETSSKVSQLEEDDRNDWLWDLRFELLRSELEFNGVEVPLKRVEVAGRICFDALTKNAFLNKVSQVRKGIIVVQWMLARKFVRQPATKELGFHR